MTYPVDRSFVRRSMSLVSDEGFIGKEEANDDAVRDLARLALLEESSLK